MSTENAPSVIYKYALVLSYVGTKYCGWQRQSGNAAHGEPSIQHTIEEKIAQMTGETASCVGSGRTDSGVHALRQIAHITLRRKEWEPWVLQRGLNSLLPTDIRVMHVQKVANDFHAQHAAEKKQYCYFFQQGPSALAHLEPYSWWIQKKLNLEAMNEALQVLEGEHDFKPFQAAGSKPGPTVRRILSARASWEPIPFPTDPELGFGLVAVRLKGTGFLKQMVRGIAGTLLQIGENRRPASDVKRILESMDRTQVGPTAPARALWLERVWYPEKYEIP